MQFFWRITSAIGVNFNKSDFGRNLAEVVLQPGTRPGECFAFEGSKGNIMIKLITPVIYSVNFIK